METNILIIGAGFAGAATGYYLHRLGLRDVVVLEREAIAGVHSSGRNAAMVRAEIADPETERLALQGRAVLETGEMAAYARNGAMLLGHGDDDVSEVFPAAQGKGRWCPEDGVVDVHALLQAYLKPLTVQYNTELLSWKRVGNRFHVQTKHTKFVATTLVNAAGSWAGLLGGLKLTPKKRHIFVTTPMGQIDSQWPFVWDDRAGLYFRPESGGLLLSGCDEAVSAPGEYGENPAALEELARKVSTLQPGLGDLTIQQQWAGHRTFSEDHRFVIGFDSRVERLFHVAALGGHGVTTSPAYGQLAASMIAGAGPTGASPFDPARAISDKPIQA